jgi:hypothetical protein
VNRTSSSRSIRDMTSSTEAPIMLSDDLIRLE